MKNKWFDKEITKYYTKKLNNRLILVGEYISGQVKLLCVVDTGRLRGSVTYAVINKISKVDKTNARSDKPNKVKQSDATSKPDQGLTLRVGTSVDYASKIELKKSFLRNGFIISKKAIKQILTR